MTWSFLRRGYGEGATQRTLSRTHAPETWGALSRQRNVGRAE